MKDPGKVVIIGAGPTGLGAAHRLRELGVADFVVLEARQQPGGLATSYVDDCGFTWDVGGHVQFSHYRYYDEVLDRVMTRGWLEHERVAAIWIRGRWVPYPFQNNIHRMDVHDRDRMLRDLETIAAAPPQPPPANFEQWIEQSFGRTMADIFLIPYNRKVWGYPLASMGVDWIGERVATVDINRIRRNVAENRDDVGWGPNNRFRFPMFGGTGAIWTDLAATLPAGRIRYGTTVEEVDPDARLVRLVNGETLTFDHLVTTMPLDVLCARTTALDVDAQRAAASLRHSSVHILGIGLRGAPPPDVQRKCWMYLSRTEQPLLPRHGIYELLATQRA